MSTREAAAATGGTSCFTPGADWTLLSQGAEARIWKVPKLYDTKTTATLFPTACPVICKERFAKQYRHPVLDARLTKQRCRMEARLLEKCKALGGSSSDNNSRIAVPAVLRVVDDRLIYLEYIEGKTVRDHLEDDVLPQLSWGQQQQQQQQAVTTADPATTTTATTTNDEIRQHALVLGQLDQLARDIGSTVAKLHYAAGIVHGDLTTSNMMLKQQQHATSSAETTTAPSATTTTATATTLTLIDFGLAKNSIGETRLTTSGTLSGYTPHYASMEQIRGTGTTAQSDIYSLSATLYQLLTNTTPPDALSRADNALSNLPDPAKSINEIIE